MKRHYIHYLEWEDYKAGMWSKGSEERLEEAIAFTGNAALYGQWMEKVIYEWPRTMLHNLSNPSINRRAFLGHCAVCLATGIPEHVTRSAWQKLTHEQRVAADAVAQSTLNKWYEKQD